MLTNGYSAYGDGKSLIEILNIGFEPLLTEKEYRIYKKIGIMKKKKYYYENAISILQSRLLYDDDTSTHTWLNYNLNNNNIKLAKVKKIEKYAENIFRNMLTRNTVITRQLIDNREFRNKDQFRNINIFESDLTRSFGCKDMDHSDDIISVVTYYTEIFNSIIHNGFDYKDKHYVFFTAGAGQTRCKKCTFVSEDKLNENYNRLFCGLTKEMINNLGGMNTNKFLAYTSLCQTNSEIWTEFNIDRAIVVNDIEFEIPDQTVRYIYTETQEDKDKIIELQKELDEICNELRLIKLGKNKGVRRYKKDIEYEKSLRSNKANIQEEIEAIKSKYHKTEIRKMSVKIPFTDGFGISLKKTQSSMIRLPFIKGLIAYLPKKNFKNFCSANGIKIYKIKDIYGVEHSIDDVDYIFTESQFKMNKYYQNTLDDSGNLIKSGWDVYRDNFKKYGCTACRCNVERKVKLNAKTNYQVLQTLTTEMTDEEIRELASYDIDNLNGIGNNIQSMLNLLGANEDKNDNLTYLQKSLLLYPEMLKDYYLKSLLKNTKNSMINKFRSGKFNINGTYTFAIPDPLACLQWWFTGERNLDRLGFLKEGQVCCTLFDDGEELDCLRSPHLDHAHCIRNNKNDDDVKPWVKSLGIYIGVNDIMSKLLMFDNDGDKILVHNNKTIIDCAKRFQDKYGMIPNYYEMSKAKPTMLDNTNLYEGIVLAYHHGNIGTPSNEITKIFATLSPESTEEEIKQAIEVAALRVVDVNFTIDFAKTLYKPTIPKQVLKKYKIYSGNKIPHFFIYAKGKTVKQVEPLGKGNIDRIYHAIQSKRIVFKDLLGKYSYKVLMSNPDVDKSSDTANKIVELYKSLNDVNLRKLSYIDTELLEIDDKKKLKIQLEFDSAMQRKQFIEYINEPVEYITDVLVKSLQNDINKDTLWRLFGDVIYENIKHNLNGTKICKVCGDRFLVQSNNDRNIYCYNCKREKELTKKKKYWNKINLKNEVV